MNRTRTFAVVLSVAPLLGVWASEAGTDASSPNTTDSGDATPTTSTATTAYEPTIDPANFVAEVTNPYFPLTPGTTYVFEGTRDGVALKAELIVTAETREILGIPCVVVRDTVTSNGALVEQTTDWYAQASNGDVWYFGEATAEFENGFITSTHGSWEAGVDGAQPGIIMMADPQVGDRYYQEYRPGEAEDRAEVLSFDPSVVVPAGTFQDILVTEDTDPLNPDKVDKKLFAPNVGLVYTTRIRTGHQEEMSLVSVTQA